MSKLDQLPEISDYVLSGLRADESLKYKIYQKAAGISQSEETKPSRRPLAALCAISAVMIAVFVLLIPLTQQKSAPLSKSDQSSDYETMEISSIPAGTVLPDSPVNIPDDGVACTDDDAEKSDSDTDDADIGTLPENESDFISESVSAVP